MNASLKALDGGAKRPSRIIDHADDVTGAVLDAMSDTSNERLKEIMASLVNHLHAFAREVRLTEAEFELGIDFLNRIGRATNDDHNEGILFSDVMGFSTLVCLLNNGQHGATETAAALLGPFWRMNSPVTENGGSIVRSQTPGPDLLVKGRITDPSGAPIADVEVDVWQASPVGLYENQDPEQVDMNLRGKFTTDADGKFWFSSVKPAGYPVPTHGPSGQLLHAQRRQPFRPAHLHFLAFKPGFKTLVTQVFAADDRNLENDVVLGVTRHLIGDFREVCSATDEAGLSDPYFELHYDFVMEEGEAKLPTPPIR